MNEKTTTTKKKENHIRNRFIKVKQETSEKFLKVDLGQWCLPERVSKIDGTPYQEIPKSGLGVMVLSIEVSKRGVLKGSSDLQLFCDFDVMLLIYLN